MHPSSLRLAVAFVLSVTFFGMTAWATDQSITIQCRFASLQNEKDGMFRALNANEIVYNMVSLCGVLTDEQMRSLQKKEILVWELPQATGKIGREIEIKDLKEFKFTPRLLGDFGKYKVPRPAHFTEEPETRNLGYDFKFKAKPEKNNGFDLEVDVSLTTFKGYEETVLPTKDTPFFGSQKSDSTGEDFPRLHLPVFDVRNVTTQITCYNSQTIAFRLGKNSARPDYSDYLFVTVVDKS